MKTGFQKTEAFILSKRTNKYISRYFKIDENMYNFQLQAMCYYSDLE